MQNFASGNFPCPSPVPLFYQWSEEDMESRLEGEVNVLEGRNGIQKDIGRLKWGIKTNQKKCNRDEFKVLCFPLQNELNRNRIWNS